MKEKQLTKRKFRDKKNQARIRGIEFNLTLEDYVSLMESANITAYDIGSKADQYCLGRIGDSGAYEIGNCRFITMNQNREESKINGCLDWTCERKRKRATQKETIVNTPWGVFNSLREAADHPDAACKHTTIHKRIKEGFQGYFYSKE